MEGFSRDLKQALSGLGLCPRPVLLVPTRLNDLVEVQWEYSDSLDFPGVERCYSYGQSGHTQVSDSATSVDPRMRGAHRNFDAFRLRWQGTGSLEVCSASLGRSFCPS
jgi:hypothetical protein